MKSEPAGDGTEILRSLGCGPSLCRGTDEVLDPRHASINGVFGHTTPARLRKLHSSDIASCPVLEPAYRSAAGLQLFNSLRQLHHTCLVS